MASTLPLFEPAAEPAGFRYAPDLLDAEEERALAAEIAALPLQPFQFHGFEGKRRVASFGWRYDFNEGTLREVEPIPEAFHPVRDKAARFAGLDPQALLQLRVTEYEPGATIGWHKDRPVFAEVVGVSLLAPCAFRFRRRDGARWLRRAIPLAPRSAYLLSSAARNDWEHSIPALDRLRYSLTFRTFRPGAKPRA